MKQKAGILYDNISGNTGDKAIGISVRKMLSDMRVDFEELVPGRFNPADYGTIVIGGGHLLRPSPDFFYDKFRITGPHILNAMGIVANPGDLDYLNEYSYISVRSQGDKSKLAYLKSDVHVVPCTAMLLEDSADFDLKIKKPNIGIQVWPGIIDETQLLEFLNGLDLHIYFLPITHYKHDFKYMAYLNQTIKRSTMLPVMGAREIFTAVGKFDYFATASLHGSIFAYAHNVPFIGLDPGIDKFQYFYDERNLHNFKACNCDDLVRILHTIMDSPPDYTDKLNHDFELLKNHRLALSSIFKEHHYINSENIPGSNSRIINEDTQAHNQDLIFQLHYLHEQVLHLGSDARIKAEQVQQISRNLQAKTDEARQLSFDLQAKTDEARRLGNELQSKTDQVRQLNDIVQAQRKLLKQIMSGTVMQLMTRFRMFTDKILPPGTHARSAYDLTLAGIRLITNEGWQSFWSRYTAWRRGRLNNSEQWESFSSIFTNPSVLSIQARTSAGNDLAVILHLYYTDLWKEMASYLSNIKEPFDIFISVPEHASDQVVKDIVSCYPHACILFTRNRGRDIAPFLEILAAVIKRRYTAALKIHTKKSLHREDGDLWRKDVLDKLLGNQAQVSKTVSALRHAGNIGLIAPSGHYISLDKYVGGNTSRMEDLASLLHLKIDYNIGFCAASMFWFKPQAMHNLVDLKLKPADFEQETSQVDGTTSHAIERLVGQVVSANHYLIITELEILHESFSDGAAVITDSYKFVD